MIALWWLISLALVVLSALLLAAGFQGKEGVLRIGQPREAEGEEPARPEPVQPADTQSGDASGQPSGQSLYEQPGPPGDAEGQGLPGAGPQGPPQERETQPRRMNLANVVTGAAGVIVGLGAILIFGI